MSFLIFVLFIWIIFIQVKLNELSSKINEEQAKQDEVLFDNPVINVSESENNTEDKEETVETCEDLICKLEEAKETEIKKPDFKFENACSGNIFNKIGAIA